MPAHVYKTSARTLAMTETAIQHLYIANLLNASQVHTAYWLLDQACISQKKPVDVLPSKNQTMCNINCSAIQCIVMMSSVNHVGKDSSLGTRITTHTNLILLFKLALYIPVL